MKPKLIATYSESRDGLFRSIRPSVEKILTRDSIDWKRTFGRPTRNIFIQLSFESFDPKSIALEESWLLCNRPYLHTFWIDCDLDAYKSSVKETVSDWLSLLKEKDIHDWLIVVIVNEDNKVKNKILRNSLYDKVKNDFCSKNIERCVILSEPNKTDAKSTDSYNQVASRLRILVVESITRVLDRFEENMRSQRERRIEHEWNFCSYFLLQEELAFMFEMISLYEDALIQYDELDALFTQFVLNSSISEPAPWLESMCKNTATRWDGTCLCQPIDQLKRNSIGLNKCSVLDLRGYLFARQGHLLVRLSRTSELVQRSIPFIHNCVKEVKLLQTELPVGAIDCWVFLSCMEILRFSSLDNKMESDDSRAMAFSSAELWTLATQKMNYIGKLCGLVSKNVQPTSDDLMIVVDLLPGLVHASGESKHLTMLVEAFSSKKSFIHHYLDLSEQSICFLKHVGRIRSAKFIGKELAEFYLTIGDYTKAEGYLVDLLKMYKSEGWEMLANDTRLKIANCQKFLNHWFRYCRTCLNIASSSSIKMATRQEYLFEVTETSKHIASEEENVRTKMRCFPAFCVSVQNPSITATVHRPLRFVLEIFSNLPLCICIDEVSVHVASTDDFLDEEKPSASQTPKFGFYSKKINWWKGVDKRKPQDHVAETVAFNFHPIAIQESVQYEETDVENEKPAVESSVVCRSPLHRSTSSPKSQKSRSIFQEHENEDVVFKVDSFTIQPGKNFIDMTNTFSMPGIYRASHFTGRLNGIDFFQSLSGQKVQFSVYPGILRFNVNMKSDSAAGFVEAIQISLKDKSSGLSALSSLKVYTSSGLSLESEDAIEGDGGYLLRDDSVRALVEGSHVTLPICVPLNTWEDEDVLNHQITLKLNDYEGDVHDLIFVNPFKISHKIITSLKKKFVRVAVSSRCKKLIEIASWKLIELANGVTFVDFSHNRSEATILHPGSCLNFLWQIEGFTESPMDVTFSMEYKERGSAEIPQLLGHSFQLKDIRTRLVTCTTSEKEELTINERCPMHFSVAPLIPPTEEFTKLRYKINFREDFWQLSGDKEGDIDLEKMERFVLTLEAKPLKENKLTLPKIVLFLATPKPPSEEEGQSVESYSMSDISLTKLDPLWSFDASRSDSVVVKELNPVKVFSFHSMPVNHANAVY